MIAGARAILLLGRDFSTAGVSDILLIVRTSTWDTVAALADPVRRALFDYVRRQDHPVSREEAADARDISQPHRVPPREAGRRRAAAGRSSHRRAARGPGDP
jgi:hypothetical protein